MLTNREVFIVKLVTTVQSVLDREKLEDGHIVTVINMVDNMRQGEHLDISFMEMVDIFEDVRKVFEIDGVHAHLRKNIDIVTMFLTQRYVDFVKYEEEKKGHSVGN